MRPKLQLISLLSLMFFTKINAQIGIGTENPISTLHVEGQPNINNIVDGITPPVLTKKQLINKKYSNDINATEGYTPALKGTIIYVDDVNIDGLTDIEQTQNVVNKGIYVYNGVIWTNVKTSILNVTNYKSTDPQRLDDINKFNSQRITFKESDKFVDNIAKLTNDYGFRILEDGYYEIGAYLGVNPNVTLVQGSNFFSAFNVSITIKDGITGIEDQLAGVRHIIEGIKGLTVTGVIIPRLIVYLKENDVLYYNITFPRLELARTLNLAYNNPIHPNDGVIDRGVTIDNEKQILQGFSKSILITKL